MKKDKGGRGGGKGGGATEDYGKLSGGRRGREGRRGNRGEGKEEES